MNALLATLSFILILPTAFSKSYDPSDEEERGPLLVRVPSPSLCHEEVRGRLEEVSSNADMNEDAFDAAFLDYLKILDEGYEETCMKELMETVFTKSLLIKNLEDARLKAAMLGFRGIHEAYCWLGDVFLVHTPTTYTSEERIVQALNIYCARAQFPAAQARIAALNYGYGVLHALFQADEREQPHMAQARAIYRFKQVLKNRRAPRDLIAATERELRKICDASTSFDFEEIIRECRIDFDVHP